MRYPPELVDTLAGEYVVGTLKGPARRRFEALIATRTDVRLAVHRWEIALQPLVRSLDPVAPPAAIWRAIARRLEPTPQRRAAPRWRWLGMALPLALVAAFWLGGQFQRDLPTPVQQAIFADADANALWRIEVDEARQTLSIATRSVPPLTPDQVYELWALPDGQAPVSLGLLPAAAGTTRTELTPVRLAALGAASTLAISIEPTGGSPVGTPTGPVVYQAPWVRL